MHAEHVGMPFASPPASSVAISCPSGAALPTDPSENSAIVWLGVQPRVEKALPTDPMRTETDWIQREQPFEVRIEQTSFDHECS
jgi:hypothetical protein